ncbi:MAG: hypothetical protein ACJARD_000234, partial [Alphaproteobacteria bacterium]
QLSSLYIDKNTINFWWNPHDNEIIIDDNFTAHTLKIVFKGNNKLIIGKMLFLLGIFLLLGTIDV